MGRDVPYPADYLGSVVSSPSGVLGTAAAENECWRILKARERSILYPLPDNLRRGGGNLHLRPPTPNSVEYVPVPQ